MPAVMTMFRVKINENDMTGVSPQELVRLAVKLCYKKGFCTSTARSPWSRGACS